MKNSMNLPRRDFLSKSVKGTLALGLGMSSIATLLQSFSSGVSTGPEDAKTEAEYRMKLSPHVATSLMSSQIAVDKASNQKVKMFATFELAEMTAMSKILKEMGTTMPALDAKAQAMMDKMKAASGAEFDRMYIHAQVETHETLRDLTADYIKNALGKTSMPEMHARHIATLALPAITEHITLSKMIKGELA